MSVAKIENVLESLCFASVKSLGKLFWKFHIKFYRNHNVFAFFLF